MEDFIDETGDYHIYKGAVAGKDEDQDDALSYSGTMRKASHLFFEGYPKGM